MNDKLLISLLKIIKHSKQIAIDAFEQNNSETSYIDFDTIFNDIDKLTQKLSSSIEKESKTFDKDYKDEEQMIDALTKSISNINKPLKKLANIYTDVLNTKNYDDEIQKILVSKVIEKILNKYLHWADKLELALMDMDIKEVIFSPNLDDEIKLVKYISENTNQNYTCWLPFFSGIGLGFLLDDD